MMGHKVLESCAFSLCLHCYFFSLKYVYSRVRPHVPGEMQSHRINMPNLPTPRVPKFFGLRSPLHNLKIIELSKECWCM